MGSASKPAMPFIYRILPDKDCGIVPAPLLGQFIKILGIFFRKFIIQPFVKDKYVIVANPFSVFGQFPQVIALVLKVAHQVRHSYVQYPVSLSASPHAQGTCKVCLARTGRACDDKVYYRGFFYLSGLII